MSFYINIRHRCHDVTFVWALGVSVYMYIRWQLVIVVPNNNLSEKFYSCLHILALSVKA